MLSASAASSSKIVLSFCPFFLVLFLEGPEEAEEAASSSPHKVLLTPAVNLPAGPLGVFPFFFALSFLELLPLGPATATAAESSSSSDEDDELSEFLDPSSRSWRILLCFHLVRGVAIGVLDVTASLMNSSFMFLTVGSDLKLVSSPLAMLSV